jgi:hypothetical protein
VQRCGDGPGRLTFLDLDPDRSRAGTGVVRIHTQEPADQPGADVHDTSDDGKNDDEGKDDRKG